MIAESDSITPEDYERRRMARFEEASRVADELEPGLRRIIQHRTGREMCVWDALRATGRIAHLSEFIKRVDEGRMVGGEYWVWPGQTLVKRRAKHCGIPVVCIDTGIQYASLTEAAYAIGASRSRLGEAIRQGMRCRELRWKFIDRPTPPPKRRIRGASWEGSPVRVVSVIEEKPVNEEFPSIRAAAVALGVSMNAIYHALSRGARCQGRRLEYVQQQHPRPAAATAGGVR